MNSAFQPVRHRTILLLLTLDAEKAGCWTLKSDHEDWKIIISFWKYLLLVLQPCDPKCIEESDIMRQYIDNMRLSWKSKRRTERKLGVSLQRSEDDISGGIFALTCDCEHTIVSDGTDGRNFAPPYGTGTQRTAAFFHLLQGACNLNECTVRKQSHLTDRMYAC
jgi:hypothetical protein